MKKGLDAASYTNRKGKTYYLHAAVRKSGKTVYVMKRSAQGALTELPEGYEIEEGINSEVSVGRQKPRKITGQEEAQVVTALKRLGLNHYRCKTKQEYLTVYEPLYSITDLSAAISGLAGHFTESIVPWMQEKLANSPLDPVMRFHLIDEEDRLFTVERMTYRGDGGWHSLTWRGETLGKLIDTYLPHLGKESFFELV